MSNELAKVLIRAYEKPEEVSQQEAPVATFTAMFNPSNFSVDNTFQYDDSQSDAETGSEQKFKSIAPREFDFNFLLDGTGASGEKIDVETEIEKFKKTTGFAGKKRRPLFLSLTWGTFTIRCVLKKMNVKYTLFRTDGTPVRGEVQASFAQYKTVEQQLLENPLSKLTSLTQLRDITAVDDLVSMGEKIYNDANKYIDIARANGLDSVRELSMGGRLEFPPLEQLEQQGRKMAEQILADGIQEAQSAAEQALAGATRQMEDLF